MSTYGRVSMLVAGLLFLGGCSDEPALGEASESHVLEDQVEALESAEQVESLLQEAAETQAQAIEVQTE